MNDDNGRPPEQALPHGARGACGGVERLPRAGRPRLGWMCRRPANLRRDDDGAVTVELALSSALVLAPMLLGLSDLSLYMLGVGRVDQGIAAAVQHVIANADGGNTGEITASVIAAAQSGAGDDTIAVTVNDVFICYPLGASPTRQGAATPPCGDGDDPVQYVEVVATSAYTPLFDYPLIDPVIPIEITTRVRVGGGDG